MAEEGNPATDPDTTLPQLADLPEDAQVALLSAASAALPKIGVADLPPGLRRFARFTPARRTRLAATALIAALDDDASFRHRVAEATGVPTRAQPHTDGAGAPADENAPAGEDGAESRVETTESADLAEPEPLTRIVALFLRRPAGWSAEVERLADGLVPGPRVEPANPAPDRRLVARLGELRAQLAQQRDEHRQQVKALKDDNATLRRTVRAERDKAGAAGAERDKLAGELATLRASTAATERRLAQRLIEATDDLGEARRARRSERGDESLRLRLLVDTLTGVAAGLRRELALPAAPDATLPADGVEAREPGDGGGTGARITTDRGARVLSDRLVLPKAHLIVDGYNVTKTAWPTVPLADQRARLVSALSGLQARTHAEVTLVFDGADLRVVPTVSGARGIRVRFSPEGVVADDVIRDLVAAEPPGRVVLAVSSDNALAADLARAGATVFGSATLIELFARG